MKIAIILALVAAVTSQNVTDFPSEPDLEIDGPPPDQFDLASALITGLVNSDVFKNKLKILYDVFDLKIRFHQVIKQALQRENLLLWRRILDFVGRVCNFLMGFLPEPTPVNKLGFLDAFFPVVQLNDPENPVQRVSRDTNLTDRDLFEKHKDDVIQVAKLIYNTP